MRKPDGCWPIFLIFIFFLGTLHNLCTARDILPPTQSITDGETLVSALGTFELGFFSLGSSNKRYVGIWYKNIPVQTVVWVANRESPLAGTAGALKIGVAGDLVVVDGASRVVWSTGVSGASNQLAQLLDSGNLVVRDATDGRIIWQSFDHPSDTLLPDMKLSSRMEVGLTSWKDDDDPSFGRYTLKMDVLGLPEMKLYRGQELHSRSGPWNGEGFSYSAKLVSYVNNSLVFFSDEHESYYQNIMKDSSIIHRKVLDKTGVIKLFVWSNRTSSWNVVYSLPKDQCDLYSHCGANGVCKMEDMPMCKCLRGFEPRSLENWKYMDFSSGCARKTNLNCQSGEGFWKLERVKVPDTSRSVVNRSMSVDECRKECLNTCSCTAYSSANITGGRSGCIMWMDDLFDVAEYESNGQDLFVKLASNDLDEVDTAKSNYTGLEVIIAAVTVSFSFFLLVLSCFCLRLRKKQEESRKKGAREFDSILDLGDDSRATELSQFNYDTVVAATNNFSAMYKLGKGGFGPVYKGILADGQEVAVKRLSSGSGQGLLEFKNEVKLIGRLQHTNLVRLIGFCTKGREKILIYEYMPNKSLDTLLFDPIKSNTLNWSKRMQIIEGIAQGLLYLHKYSRLRVIHRDLKASNILLDAELNPKISDFGMARIFSKDQNQGNTKRIVGTFGYMPPEYALHGRFSEKSDVFSFGVLLLEIVSGKRNTLFSRIGDSWSLQGYVWDLWLADRSLELVDPVLDGEFVHDELLRCIKVGLLCVQERPKERPTMTSILSFLSRNSASIPSPKQPAFCFANSSAKLGIDSNRRSAEDLNDVTFSLEAR